MFPSFARQLAGRACQTCPWTVRPAGLPATLAGPVMQSCPRWNELILRELTGTSMLRWPENRQVSPSHSVFLTSHAQRSAASSDGYPVCFPFEPSLSLARSLSRWRLCVCFLFSQPHHLFMEQVQLPALMSGNDAWTQKWQWVAVRVAGVDNGSRAMEVKRFDSIRDAEVNYQSSFWDYK